MDYLPKVSVIIPVYNVENYLRECLDSVIGQTLRDIEIICVDDGSTDSSLSILREYEEKDPRLTVLTQENKGAGAARNKGLASANGKYIAFMDADDYYPNLSVLQTMVKAAELNNARICGGGICTNNAGKIIPGTDKDSDHYYGEERIISYIEVQCDYGYYRYIFERDMLEENNIVFPDYLRFQDPPFFVRAMLAAGQFYALSQDVYCYRVGHKRVPWTDRQVNDLVCGIRDVYELAKENSLNLLAERCLRRINSDYKNIFYTALKREGNQKLFYRLMEFNVRINTLQHQEDLLVPIDMILDSSREKAGIGHFFTWLPRKIRGGIRCYQEHGFPYTLWRIKEHLLR